MKSIPVYFDNRMAARADSYSPSASKAPLVVSDWLKHGMPIEVRDFAPATHGQLCLAHDPAYVQGVLSLKIDNGFGNRSQAVANALPYQVGSLLAAAAAVTANGRTSSVACSPSSGFHHAHYVRSRGFCTFNALIIAAMVLRSRGLVRSVGILDCDHHYGDGTADIINELDLNWIVHRTAGEHFAKPQDADQFDRWLGRSLVELRGCDLVIYQAGADQHEADPLGGMLNAKQMAWRDRRVFHTMSAYRVPLVWCLAGGYQRDSTGSIDPVLALHYQTMQQCVDIYVGGQELRP